MKNNNVIIIGAGPSGLGCAYTLAQADKPVLIIEKEDFCGGLCRTIDFGGYLFDIGGHRFLTKSKQVNSLWQEMLGTDLLEVKRLSRIYYRNKFFHYPLSFLDVIKKLGFSESGSCFLDYFKHKIFPSNDTANFEGWVTNHFGNRLYKTFFKTYTEKVWGMPCRSLSSAWAEQRIRGLSLKVAFMDSLRMNRSCSPKTLSAEFLYPKRGPGQFYNHVQDYCINNGGEFRFNTKVVRVRHDNERINAIEVESIKSGEKRMLEIEYLFSSMPLPSLIKLLEPSPRLEILHAASQLKFRSLITVNIILDKEEVFSDQWIYIHSPEVKLGRIQNFKNWSPFMVADAKKTTLSLEYFCSEDDALWRMSDIDLIDLALRELTTIGFCLRNHFIDGFVVRIANVYPVYSLNYRDHVSVLQKYLGSFHNLQTMGRSGVFCYDNSDFALLGGMHAAMNYLDDRKYDLWQWCTDAEYLES